MPDLLLTSLPAALSSYTVSEMYDRVRGDIGLRGNNYVTDADLLRWGNEAARRVARDWHWYRESFIVGTTANTKDYSNPSRIIAVQEVLYDGTPLTAYHLDDFYHADEYFRSDSTGTPLFYYLRGDVGYSLHPTPDTTDADILTIHGTAVPPHVSLATDFFYIPTAYEDIITTYVKWRAAQKDAMGEGRLRMQDYEREWYALLSEGRRYMQEIQERYQLVAGADASYGGPHRYWIYDDTIAAL